MTQPGAPPARRSVGRIAVPAAAAVALVAGVVVLRALFMVGGAGCVTEDVRRAPDGAWRIEVVDCGATVTLSWRVLVRGADGRERLALENIRYPEPVEAVREPGLLRVRLAGEGPWREVPLDRSGRPLAALRLSEGTPVR